MTRKTLFLPTGRSVPRLGLGTWQMGEDPAARRAEADALRLGLDLGMTLIDTAEMYAEGQSEVVVGDAIEGRRDEVYLVSKVLPHHANRRGTVAACEKSLRRLRTDRLDLYLLHWPGRHPLEETLRAFEDLKAAGKIVDGGLSNFDTAAWRRARSLAGGASLVSNQVLYNLTRRGIEFDLLGQCASDGAFVMAYSPLEQGRIPERPGLLEVARRHGVPASTIALAFTLRHPQVVSIPKASKREHLEANVRALDLVLGAEDLALLDRDFPPPTRKVRLETI